jgi:hypothetical protein
MFFWMGATRGGISVARDSLVGVSLVDYVELTVAKRARMPIQMQVVVVGVAVWAFA